MSARPLTKRDLELQMLAKAMPTPVHLDYLPWTGVQVEYLLKLYREGLSYGEIATLMKCSRNSVAGQVHRMGLSR